MEDIKNLVEAFKILVRALTDIISGTFRIIKDKIEDMNRTDKI